MLDSNFCVKDCRENPFTVVSSYFEERKIIRETVKDCNGKPAVIILKIITERPTSRYNFISYFNKITRNDKHKKIRSLLNGFCL